MTPAAYLQRIVGGGFFQVSQKPSKSWQIQTPLPQFWQTLLNDEVVLAGLAASNGRAQAIRLLELMFRRGALSRLLYSQSFHLGLESWGKHCCHLGKLIVVICSPVHLMLLGGPETELAQAVLPANDSRPLVVSIFPSVFFLFFKKIYVCFAMIVIVTFACTTTSSGIHISIWGFCLYLRNLMLQTVRFHLRWVLIFWGRHFDCVCVFYDCLFLGPFLPTIIIHIVTK